MNFSHLFCCDAVLVSASRRDALLMPVVVCLFVF